MAEGLFRSRLKAIGRDDISVSSMGIHGLDQQPPTPLALEVCTENGIDISAHRSQPLQGEAIVAADLILAMDPLQQDFVKLFFPQIAERVFLLGAWPAEGSRRDAVPDPMGKPKKVYRHVFELIERNIARILPAIEELFAR
jgi:protein-tyrosine-phosphatase